MKIEQYANKNITNTTHLNSNTEWQILYTWASVKQIVTSDGLYWWVSNYVIKIKRKISYHIYNLILPCLGNFKMDF